MTLRSVNALDWCSFGDNLKRVAKQVQGALPIVGLLSRLTAPAGGIGKDMLVLAVLIVRVLYSCRPLQSDPCCISVPQDSLFVCCSHIQSSAEPPLISLQTTSSQSAQNWRRHMARYDSNAVSTWHARSDQTGSAVSLHTEYAYHVYLLRMRSAFLPARCFALSTQHGHKRAGQRRYN